jgi:NitT/TauT family transport system permease protein
VRLPELRDPRLARSLDVLWLVLVIVFAAWGGWTVVTYVSRTLTWGDALKVFGLGSLTLARVLVLIAVASVIWVPIGVWIGLRPIWAERIQPVAQFLAAFPANVLFPAVVGVIVALNADPNIWLSPLMILGTQWYILFNVIAGASAIPNDLKEAASMFKVRRWQWWRDVALPAIFPYYVTGALTASGGSWNASIVAEVVNWRRHNIEAAGLGSYIADATAGGDYPKVALGIAVMAVFVILLNRILWRPVYAFASRRLHLS